MDVQVGKTDRLETEPTSSEVRRDPRLYYPRTHSSDKSGNRPVKVFMTCSVHLELHLINMVTPHPRIRSFLSLLGFFFFFSLTFLDASLDLEELGGQLYDPHLARPPAIVLGPWPSTLSPGCRAPGIRKAVHKKTSSQVKVLPNNKSHLVPAGHAGRTAREADVTDAPGVRTRVRVCAPGSQRAARGHFRLRLGSRTRWAADPADPAAPGVGGGSMRGGRRPARGALVSPRRRRRRAAALP